MTEHLTKNHPEQAKTPSDFEFVYFKSENEHLVESAKLYRQVGEVVDFENPSDYVTTTTIVHTKDGNDYIVHAEVVVDVNSNTGLNLGHGTLEDIEIGKPWNIPGLGMSSKVEHVLRDGVGIYRDQDAKFETEKIRPDNPFIVARENIRKFISREGLENSLYPNQSANQKRKLGSWIRRTK